MWFKRALRPTLLLFLFWNFHTVSAGATATGFLNRTVTVGAATYRYQVYVPANYDPAEKWPIVVYLHGNNANGNDGLNQTEGGLGSAIRRHPERCPFIVVFPQCARDAFWVGPMVEQALQALNQTVSEFNGDPQRLYLTGISMGGYGTWYTAIKHPGKFAAIVPICGGIMPPMKLPVPLSVLVGPDLASLVESPDPHAAIAKVVGKTPTWIFHGAADTNVPVTDSRRMAAALKANGGNVRYTEYEDLGHEACEKPYADPELYSWLLTQRLGK
jgi:predicted peptidase